MTTPRTFQDVIASENFLILDTETTGLNDGEIVQIAILNPTGETVLDTLVKPYRGIPEDARRIHGISLEMTANAPHWNDLVPHIYNLLQGRDVVVYNADYDRKMFYQSTEKAGIVKINWKVVANWWCAMDAYAKFWGEWDDYHGSYRWQRLSNAAQQQAIEIKDAHSALGDCLMTLAVIRAMQAKNWKS